MEYSKIAYYAALFTNDLRHIYIHAAGSSMEEIRTSARTLYYKAASNFEDFSKKAIINGEKVGNINSIRSYIPDTEWKSIEEDAVDFNCFTSYLRINGQQYLNSLKNFRDDRTLDETIKYWEDAIIYDNELRMATSDKEEEQPTVSLSDGKVLSQPDVTNAVVIGIPDWRSLGATSALSKSILGN